MLLEEAGNNTRAGEQIRRNQLLLAQACLNPLHRAADEIQQGTFIADVRDNLLPQKSRVLLHGVGPAC